MIKDPEARRRYHRDRYWALVDLGLCVRCGKDSPAPEHKVCPACALAMAFSARLRRANRRASK